MYVPVSGAVTFFVIIGATLANSTLGNFLVDKSLSAFIKIIKSVRVQKHLRLNFADGGTDVFASRLFLAVRTISVSTHGRQGLKRSGCPDARFSL